MSIPPSTRPFVFYVLYLPDWVGRAIDAIRYFANPYEKWLAHITVRGPYLRRLRDHKLKEFNGRLSGNQVTIDGVGSFRENGQATVFFRCTGTKLRDVWYKRDYPYNPHVTLYDGPSHEVADQLDAVVRRFKYNLTFRCDQLQPLTSQKGASTHNLALSQREDFIEEVLGASIRNGDVLRLSLSERMAHIETFCRYLGSISDTSESRPVDAQSAREVGLFHRLMSRLLGQRGVV